MEEWIYGVPEIMVVIKNCKTVIQIIEPTISIIVPGSIQNDHTPKRII